MLLVQMENWLFGSQNHHICHKAWLKVYVSVNSKPDHSPGQFFDGRIPHPPGKEKFKTPTAGPIKTS